MFQKGICSRETVLNFFLDRFRTEISDIMGESNSDPAGARDLLINCLDHFSKIDLPYSARVRGVLDHVCEFYKALSAYIVICGRTNSIYTSSGLVESVAGEDNIPTNSDFSLLLINRMRNELKPGKVCFLDNVENLKHENREVYEHLTKVGIVN